MKKLISILFIIIIICTMSSCGSTSTVDNRIHVEAPFKLITYEKDSHGYVIHKILYDTNTSVYHEYTYTYKYDYGYRVISTVTIRTYDASGNIITSEVITE